MKNSIPNKPVVTASEGTRCRGSISLGTACMICESCLEQWEMLYGDSSILTEIDNMKQEFQDNMIRIKDNFLEKVEAFEVGDIIEKDGCRIQIYKVVLSDDLYTIKYAGHYNMIETNYKQNVITDDGTKKGITLVSGRDKLVDLIVNHSYVSTNENEICLNFDTLDVLVSDIRDFVKSEENKKTCPHCGSDKVVIDTYPYGYVSRLW